METKNVPSGPAGHEDILGATADGPGGEVANAKAHEQRDFIGELGSAIGIAVSVSEAGGPEVRDEPSATELTKAGDELSQLDGRGWRCKTPITNKPG